jgi:hypothetical protein
MVLVRFKRLKRSRNFLGIGLSLVRLNPHHAAVDHTRLSMSFDFAFSYTSLDQSKVN